jgi:hypothetical protein
VPTSQTLLRNLKDKLEKNHPTNKRNSDYKSEVFLGNVGIGRRRNTLKEMSASTKTISIGKNTIKQHTEGIDFNSNCKAERNLKSPNPNIHYLETGAAHKSTRAIINLRSQINLKGEQYKSNLVA